MKSRNYMCKNKECMLEFSITIEPSYSVADLEDDSPEKLEILSKKDAEVVSCPACQSVCIPGEGFDK